MSSGDGNSHLIYVQPDELKFQFKLEKQSYCALKVGNNSENCVAFKVKTTSPKKYFVRPNTGVIQPWDSCIIRVTLQAQREYPPDMQCKDKFLLQSTVVPQHTEIDELPQVTFNKESGTEIEEYKLRVLYILPSAVQGNSENGAVKSSTEIIPAHERAKEERDLAIRQTQLLQQKLDILKRRRYRKSDLGFSFGFAILVGLIGMMVGFLLSLLFSSSSRLTSPSPPTE